MFNLLFAHGCLQNFLIFRFFSCYFGGIIASFFKQMESLETRKLNSIHLRVARISWQLILAPWRLLFAFVPPYHFAHGWIAFIFSLLFISGIAYIVTKLTDVISCVTGFQTLYKLLSQFPFLELLIIMLYLLNLCSQMVYIIAGINAYVIAFTALASGTSWPDLVASKIAAERQTTADSAIANITCRFFITVLYLGYSYMIFGHFQIPKCFHHIVSYSKRDSGKPHWFEYYSW